ncbi:putative Histidine kinase [Candidatus Filomicrobium marinum]|uniref:histidine kinase n=1 Tax=Candidatus Filomicrobium marinum TaxID=1608628 RepID=A0A0D6JCM0_9HYPH|nr:HAMP domain-containing sensor histidine kinase [Candidatus Filomicrobium marinum]CFX11888.1 putative Histidine kinase [Candidatus Filomicrobium marinum]CPR17353.1 putative Histidine kinase [Candidatus Filomicrobium marinum]
MTNNGYQLEQKDRPADSRCDVVAREEAKSLCSSTVHELAHELKTPISAIVAAAEIMRDERLGPLANERYRGYVGDIHENAAQMLKLIDRLLARRILEQASDELEPVEIDTEALVRATASALQPLAEQAGLKLQVSVGPGLPTLVADPTSVRQILVNLLTNALKFTPRGGEVLIEAHPDPSGRTVIAIIDNGGGMDEDQLLRALDGVRSHPPTDGSGGSGIGLRLVKALSQANGAEFSLASQPGQGTRATITFNPATHWAASRAP